MFSAEQIGLQQLFLVPWQHLVRAAFEQPGNLIPHPWQQTHPKVVVAAPLLLWLLCTEPQQPSRGSVTLHVSWKPPLQPNSTSAALPASICDRIVHYHFGKTDLHVICMPESILLRSYYRTSRLERRSARVFRVHMASDSLLGADSLRPF